MAIIWGTEATHGSRWAALPSACTAPATVSAVVGTQPTLTELSE